MIKKEKESFLSGKIKLKLREIPIQNEINQILKSGETTIKLRTYATIVLPEYGLTYTNCDSYYLCHDEKCHRCYNRSFCGKERVKCWSTENTIHPRMVTKSSPKKYWFNCSTCCHTYKQALNSIEMPHRNRGCPFCNGNQKRCSDGNCMECHKDSFANSPSNLFWSDKNGNLKPRDIARSGKDVIWLRCSDCSHDYQIVANEADRGRRCPYCASKSLCGKCEYCFKSSFASHPKASYWSNKNKLQPNEVFLNSNDLYWFKCSVCNYDFETTPNSINNLKTWCPICRNKTEKKLYDWLSLFETAIKRSVNYTWCKSNTDHYLPFDFVFEGLKLIIELDGDQHFSQVYGWKSPEKQQENDIYKMNKALEHGYSCIRVLQTDVWHDQNDWENKLKEAIKSYSTPTIIYIDHGSIYDIYKKITHC